MKQCCCCRVEGVVQGVFFRAATTERARELGVTGWAHNLPDGSVEVMACGNHDAVTALCDWLWQGSPQAQVRDVQCREVAWQSIDEFRSR